jgi:hypothetical protein
VKQRRSKATPAARPAASPKTTSRPRPPKDVDRDRYLVWRFARTGVRNPHDLTNPAWVWLARNPELNAWQANELMRGPSSLEVGPHWCAQRFGQSRTELPDGRTVAIGGEHEDSYDPDFFIYNDVLVLAPSGDVRIYGYPYDVFGPTDFHSATLLADGRIVIIGCLGYVSSRAPGTTPVHALDTTTFAMSRLASTGERPGWIFKHAATLGEDGRTIRIAGGERLVLVDGERQFVENIDDWALSLDDGRWSRLTDRRWQEWSLERADGRLSDLFSIWMVQKHADGKTPFDREQVEEYKEKHGSLPDFALYDDRYSPPLAHTRVPGDEFAHPTVVRNVIEGVTVRYVEEGAGAHVIVEGPLSQEQIDVVIEDARKKLEALEGAGYVSRRLQ